MVAVIYIAPSEITKAFAAVPGAFAMLYRGQPEGERKAPFRRSRYIKVSAASNAKPL